MSEAGRARIAVRISEDVWLEEVERLKANSPARIAAERDRKALDADGLELEQLQACEEAGPDGTNLAGMYKVVRGRSATGLRRSGLTRLYSGLRVAARMCF